MAKNFVQPGEVLTIPVSVAVGSGAVVIAGGIKGVAQISAPAGGGIIDVATEGVFELSKVSADAFTVGASVYYVSASGLVTTTSSGNTYIGLATEAAASGAATVKVRLGTL